MVIGLTGPNAAGKGEAALYLKSKGFIYHSLSDTLREKSKKSGIKPSRENLIRLGNELRQKNGPSVLALMTIGKLTKTENHVVDSIRNPGEIEELRKIESFFLIGIDAPVELRFRRTQERKRYGDAKSLQDFIKKEKKENKKNPENQQLKTCLRMANVVIVNNSTLEGFHNKIDEAVKKYKKT